MIKASFRRRHRRPHRTMRMEHSFGRAGTVRVTSEADNKNKREMVDNKIDDERFWFDGRHDSV